MNFKMKKGFCLFILLIATYFISAQQDPQYSLYQFNQMVINPAYAGARGAVAVVIDARKQWVSFPGAPSTLAASIHSPVLNNKVGVGLNLVSDNIGAKSVIGAYGNFAYILKLTNKYKLSFGLRAGYVNYKFNFSRVNYKDANETALAEINNSNRGTIDIDGGLFLKSNSFFLGLSASHLNQGKIFNENYSSINTGVQQSYNTSYVLNTHLFAIIGKAFSRNENFIFSPCIMIKRVRENNSVDVNLNFLLQQRIWLGVYTRLGYGIGALFQVYATDKFRIGYSYDTGFGAKKRLGSSHEIMIGFDFGKYKAKTVSPRFL